VPIVNIFTSVIMSMGNKLQWLATAYLLWCSVHIST